MQPENAPEFVVATYEEIRARFGLGGTDQARIKAKRRKWEVEARNNPGAMARVRVPRMEWDATPIDRDRSPGTVIPFAPDQSRSFKPLADAVAAFREVEAQLRAERDAARAERGAAQAEAAAQRSRAERAEGAEGVLRESLTRAETRAARDGARADQADAARRAAEVELAGWTAGGPLARAWRALRGRA
jgi:hypothetical protein